MINKFIKSILKEPGSRFKEAETGDVQNKTGKTSSLTLGSGAGLCFCPFVTRNKKKTIISLNSCGAVRAQAAFICRLSVGARWRASGKRTAGDPLEQTSARSDIHHLRPKET